MAKYQQKLTFKKAGKLFRQGFHKYEDFQWKYGQLQVAPPFKIKKDVKARDFGNLKDAVKYEQEKKKKGYHTQLFPDFTYFYGIICEKPQEIFWVYYSKNPVKLEPNTGVNAIRSSSYSKTPECTPRGLLPKPQSEKALF